MLRRSSIIILFLVATLSVASQKTQKINLFLSGQASFMVYDQFKQFTGGGFGTGLHAIINSKHNLKPLVDVSANLFSANKILFVFEDGQKTGPKQSVTTITAGFIYKPASRFELALSAGTAIHDDGTDLGIKPFVAYYLGKKKILKVYTSLTHVFVSNKIYSSGTGVLGAGLSIKLF